MTEAVEIRRPIIVIGIGRSGSSIFHEIFAHHPGVSWLSEICDRHPRRPDLNRRVLQASRWPVIGAEVQRRLAPAECYTFWEHHCGGFRTPFRDLRAGDLSERARRRILRVLPRTMAPGRDRLLLKITGWPRTGYLRALFPDALFIHVRRDARAVVNSLMNVPWWWGWRGPENWRWGPLSPYHRELWEKHARSFVALAAIQYRIFEAALARAVAADPGGNLKEVVYETLCEAPVETFREVVAHCDLAWDGAFERRVAATPLRDTNFKWREDLTADQQRILEEVLQAPPDPDPPGAG